VRIAITGATGLLGRNLLFEVIKQNLANLDDLQIFILGRDKESVDIQQRVEEIILNDGIQYLSLDKKKSEDIKKYIKTNIKCIDADLDDNKLGMKAEGVKLLKSAPMDFIFHVAALTDFRDTPRVVEALKRTNVQGTQQILQLASTLKVGEFVYVGSAYSCGKVWGDIKPDYTNPNREFRNPYEETKAEAEILVRNFAQKTGVRCRYFRPSTICGRLMEPPLGSINKFDVFYAWGAFFFRLKLKKLKNWTNKYKDSFMLDARICYNLKSGLNIAPADYMAKVIYQTCIQNSPAENYYLVNNQEAPHGLYLEYMLREFNVKGAKVVDKIPENMNETEKFYYKTVGKIFTPYINSEPMLFNTENLKDVLRKAKLKCPQIDEKNLSILVEYAKKYDFGLNIEESRSTPLLSKP